MTASRFHNISDADLDDMIGRQDAKAKAEAAELDALKAEMKARADGCDNFEVTGAKFVVTVADHLANKLDAALVRKHLGKRAKDFEITTISTVLRIKPNAAWLANAA